MPAVARFCFRPFPVAPSDVAPLDLEVSGRAPVLVELEPAGSSGDRPEPPLAAPQEPAPDAATADPGPMVAKAELDRAVAEAALAAARDAERRVRAEVTAELEAATEQRLARALERLADELGALHAASVAAGPVEAEAALALALAKAIVPHALERAPLADLEAMLGELLGRLEPEPRLELRLPAELVEPGRSLATELAERSGFAGELVVAAEAGLSPGDARLIWRHGRAERRLERIVAEVEAWLAGTAEAPAGAAPPADDVRSTEPEEPGGGVS